MSWRSIRAWRAPGAWALVAVLCVGNLWLHKSISNLCDALFVRFGRGPYEWGSMMAIGALCAAAGTAVILHRAAELRAPRSVGSLLGLAALTYAAQQFLLVSNIELIHFPQFALIAGLLIVAGLPPELAWLGGVTAGIIDETYQHLVVYAGMPNVYWDVNDMLLNAIGAAWAVVLMTAGAASARTDGVGTRNRGLWTAAALAAIAALVWLDPPRFSPLLKPAATGRQYRVLSAAEGLGLILVVWGLVHWACGSRSRRAAAAHSGRAVAAAVVALLAAARVDAAAAFLTTFWCGPPLTEFTDERAAEIAAAGFTVVGPPCEGPMTPELNRRALDVAARHGLQMWINDQRVEVHNPLRPQWEDALANAVAEYRAHPALAGYFLVDEPSAARFEEVAAMVEALRRHDPARLAYVNLLPDYISPEGLGAATFFDYVERFVVMVRPQLLSYDHYPFKNDSDRPSFFDGLSTVRELALRHDLPFMLIVQAMPHGHYRDPTEAEMAWQVFHALAFGARGISYFAYWTPVQVPDADHLKFRYGLIEAGKPTLHYFQAARINRTAAALGAELADFRSLGVADGRGEVGFAPPVGPIAAIDGGPVTAGLFGNPAGVLAVLLVNRDYRYATDAALRLRPDAPLPEQFDAASGQWTRATSMAVSLPPGGAQLLRWRPDA